MFGRLAVMWIAAGCGARAATTPLANVAPAEPVVDAGPCTTVATTPMIAGGSPSTVRLVECQVGDASTFEWGNDEELVTLRDQRAELVVVVGGDRVTTTLG